MEGPLSTCKPRLSTLKNRDWWEKNAANIHLFAEAKNVLRPFLKNCFLLGIVTFISEHATALQIKNTHNMNSKSVYLTLF